MSQNITERMKEEESAWEKHFSVNPEQLFFKYEFSDLYSGDEKILMEKLREIMKLLKKPEYSGPIYLIIRELLTNSLKALYKRLYKEYFLGEIGMSDLPYQQWLEIFRTEIESHRAENFANLCKEKNVSVQCNGRIEDDIFVIEVVNEGVPSGIEWRRLQSSMGKAKETTDLSYLFDDNEDEEDELHEGAGIGVPLISVMLKNMQLQSEDFVIHVHNGHTIARLQFPLRIFIESDLED